MRLSKTFAAGLIVALSGAAWADFDFNDMERIEKSEQEDLLNLARKAAKAGKLDEAQKYLDQARHKTYAPQEIAAVEKVLSDSRNAEQERLASAARGSEAAQRLAGQRGAKPCFLRLQELEGRFLLHAHNLQRRTLR